MTDTDRNYMMQHLLAEVEMRLDELVRRNDGKSIDAILSEWGEYFSGEYNDSNPLDIIVLDDMTSRI